MEPPSRGGGPARWCDLLASSEPGTATSKGHRCRSPLRARFRTRSAPSSTPRPQNATRPLDRPPRVTGRSGPRSHCRSAPRPRTVSAGVRTERTPSGGLTAARGHRAPMTTRRDEPRRGGHVGHALEEAAERRREPADGTAVAEVRHAALVCAPGCAPARDGVGLPSVETPWGPGGTLAGRSGERWIGDRGRSARRRTVPLGNEPVSERNGPERSGRRSRVGVGNAPRNAAQARPVMRGRRWWSAKARGRSQASSRGGASGAGISEWMNRTMIAASVSRACSSRTGGRPAAPERSGCGGREGRCSAPAPVRSDGGRMRASSRSRAGDRAPDG